MKRRRSVRAIAALALCGVAFGGLTNAIAEELGAGGSDENSATAQVVCPVVARTVYRFVDGDETVSEQAFLPGQDHALVDPGVPVRPQDELTAWAYANEAGEATDAVLDWNAPDASKGRDVDGDRIVTLVAVPDGSHVVRFHNTAQADHPVVLDSRRVDDGDPAGEGPRARPTSTTQYFSHWSLKNGEPYDVKREPVTRNIDLYAVFADGREVRFDTHGGTAVEADHLKAGEQFSANRVAAPTKPGYDFAYWSTSPDGPEFTPDQTPDHSFVLHAVWTPRKDTKYRVVHWKETLDGTYVIADTEELAGTTEAEAIGTPKRITEATLPYYKDNPLPLANDLLRRGFDTGDESRTFDYIYDEEHSQQERPLIDGEGTTVKNLYYKRPRVKVTFATPVIPRVRWGKVCYRGGAQGDIRHRVSLQMAPDEDTGELCGWDAIILPKFEQLGYDNIVANLAWDTESGNPDDYWSDEKYEEFSDAANEVADQINNLPPFVMEFDDVVAGADMVPYEERFDKAFREHVYHLSAGEKDYTITGGELWGDTRYLYNLSANNGRLTFLSPASPVDSVYARIYSDPDMRKWQNKWIPGGYFVHYVEVDPDHPGPTRGIGTKFTSDVYDPEGVIGGDVRVLKKDLQPPGGDMSSYTSLRNEDWPSIRGFTVVETISTETISRQELTTDGSWHKTVRYTRNSYNVTIETNGGPAPTQTHRLKFEQPLDQVDIPDFVVGETRRERDDAVFAGWYNNPEFSGDPVEDFGAELVPDHDYILYAKWEPPTYTVRTHQWTGGDTTGAVEREVKKVSLELVDSTEIEPSVPAGMDRERDFAGWYYLGPNGEHLPFNPATPIRRDYDLYPDWPSDRVSAKYGVADGSGTAPTDPATYIVGARVIAQPAPDVEPPEGMVFVGWRPRGYKDNAVFRPGEPFVLTQDLIDAQGHYHLDAVYGPTPPEAKLTYFPNGGEGDPVEQTHPSNAKVTVHPEGTFTRPGYRFLGWSHTPDGDPIGCGPGTNVIVPNGHSHLYAVWSKAPMEITVRKIGPDGQLVDGASFDLVDPSTGEVIADAVTPRDEVGTFSARGKELTSYWLRETRAPEGFELMPVPVSFHVIDGEIVLDKPDAAPNVAVDGLVMTVSDVPAGRLPATGGPGHWPYLVAGVLLLALAGYAQRRKAVG
ncbi:MAG: InlB B-repeat-containing protein [Actinomycetaceae bacterium]|nr:InlB B-repeat-containing protein [Actinomycetaceae bacterium]